MSVMMQLGSFQFSLNTAAYQEFSRTTEYRWSAQQVVGQNDNLQYNGKNRQAITLTGLVYPHYRGGLNQITSFKSLADEGQPQLLVDGLGNVHGRWVIERVEEGHKVFGERGIPYKQSFTIQIRFYDDGSNV